MSEQLPKYSGEDGCCFACNWPEADTEYVPAAKGPLDSYRRLDLDGKCFPATAFLKRTCGNCQYEWAESLVGRPEPECSRCKDSGIDPEDSDGGSGLSEYSMGEPPALEPCRNCFVALTFPCGIRNNDHPCTLNMGHAGPHQNSSGAWTLPVIFPHRCPSMSRGDQCELNTGHLLDHHNGERRWFETGGPF